MNCRPLQHDAYHQFLHFFFSIVSLTPCLSNPGLGQLGPADHAGASPLAKTSSNCKILRFWHHICQCEWLSGLFWGSTFSMRVHGYVRLWKYALIAKRYISFSWIPRDSSTDFDTVSIWARSDSRCYCDLPPSSRWCLSSISETFLL